MHTHTYIHPFIHIQYITTTTTVKKNYVFPNEIMAWVRLINSTQCISPTMVSYEHYIFVAFVNGFTHNFVPMIIDTYTLSVACWLWLWLSIRLPRKTIELEWNALRSHWLGIVFMAHTHTYSTIFFFCSFPCPHFVIWPCNVFIFIVYVWVYVCVIFFLVIRFVLDFVSTIRSLDRLVICFIFLFHSYSHSLIQIRFRNLLLACDIGVAGATF